MKDKNIFLDFDQFKFITHPDYVSFVNEWYGINSLIWDHGYGVSLESIVKKYKPEAHFDMTQFYIAVGNHFQTSIERHSNVVPMKDMCEVVKLLAKKYNLYTVTARQAHGRKVVEHLLDKFIPGCITDIHFVHTHRGNGVFDKDPKTAFVKRTPGEHVAFIDGTPEEVLEMQGIIPSYLFDPTGLHNNYKEIMLKVKSWKEIGEIFL